MIEYLFGKGKIMASETESRWNETLEKTEKEFELVGIDPTIILIVIQVVMALVKMCMAKRKKVSIDGIVPRLMLAKALWRKRVDKPGEVADKVLGIAKKYRDMSESSLFDQFVTASMELDLNLEISD